MLGGREGGKKLASRARKGRVIGKDGGLGDGLLGALGPAQGREQAMNRREVRVMAAGQWAGVGGRGRPRPGLRSWVGAQGTMLTSLACLTARMAASPSCRRNRGRHPAQPGPGRTQSQPQWPHPCFLALAASSLSHRDAPSHSRPEARFPPLPAPPYPGLTEDGPPLPSSSMAPWGGPGQQEDAGAADLWRCCWL